MPVPPDTEHVEREVSSSAAIRSAGGVTAVSCPVDCAFAFENGRFVLIPSYLTFELCSGVGFKVSVISVAFWSCRFRDQSFLMHELKQSQIIEGTEVEAVG